MFSVFQVFDDLQKMLNVTDNKSQNRSLTHSTPVQTLQVKTTPLLRMLLGLLVAVATVSVGLYAF